MNINNSFQILQELVFPEKNDETIKLYLDNQKEHTGNDLRYLKSGRELDFFAFFNLFPWDRWVEYTGISKLGFYIDDPGSITALFRSHNDKGEITNKWQVNLKGKGRIHVILPNSLLKGTVSVKLISHKDCRITEAGWITYSPPHSREIKLALAFTTYNRDSYLFPNLELIKRHLGDKVHVFVVDNASRLSKKSITSFGKNYHLYHNPNLGGSGGFTRAILEAIKSHENLTHIVLMDDDIVIEPSVIMKTLTLFSYLKPSYHRAFLAGGMIQLDKPVTLFELTANWNGIRVKNNKKGLDLSDRKTLCTVEKKIQAKNQYAAWWYCGIPLSQEMQNDLPFPFFIYGDDMDYSLRRARGILTMIGIAVWHEPFTKKFSPLFKSYFFCRNTQILNALHKPKGGVFTAWFNSASHFYCQLFVHDYRSAELALDGTQDFLKGPEYILSLNESELLKCKYRPTDFDSRDSSTLKKCYFIKDNFNRYKSPWYFFKKRLAVESYEKMKFEIRERNLKKVFELLKRRVIQDFIYLLNYHSLFVKYNHVICNASFWSDRFSKKDKKH